MPWSTDFEQAMRAFCRFVEDDSPIDPHSSLESLGMDSLQLVELIVRLEDTFDVEIPPEWLTPEAFACPQSVWDTVCKAAPDLDQAV